MRLASNRTVAGPMYDFITGTLEGLKQFLAGEQQLLQSLTVKYETSELGKSREWDATRQMLAARIAQLQMAIVDLERVMGSGEPQP